MGGWVDGFGRRTVRRKPRNRIKERDFAGFKRAALLTSVGAGALGAGLALLFARALEPFAVAILATGLLVHSWGMYQEHRLERRAVTAKVRWVEALYWLCGLALVVLVLWVVVTQSRGHG